VLVPVLANGLRAYMIVMIGHLSGMELATGVDHLIYGWLFFGLVMFVMFWIGSYWREDTDTPAVDSARAASARAAAGAAASRLPLMAAGVIGLCALWPAFALVGEHANHNPAPVALAQVPVSWPAAPAFADWKPDYMAADATIHQSYAKDATPVALTLLYYRNQNREKSLISSLNRLAGYKDSWHETASAKRTENVGGHTLAVRETVLRREGHAILVWDWMQVGGSNTTSNAVGKLLQARSKLLLQGDDGAAVMLSAPFDEDPAAARAALHAFLAANLGAIDTALAAAAQKH
jgi:EpsI family protein